ncbi:tellurite resistance TerB family protein [Bifidobacterium cebidarum]|uniref:Tellurite resistance protein TerB n=1 Tax=Bifidobacterium cebidarum TaxID=2650773 RepID=A0A6I1G9L5_9BIFI|nr:TerB family tellurite resistance protein [Bifidobacterium cebidarum]KAB7788374.1 tellurite resistance protein TerB [Bifidobacterium cebidarum]
MTTIQRKAALRAFYYLMAVDGSVTADEMELFNHIGEELDNEHFHDYAEQLVDSCAGYLSQYADKDDDRYDVIVEGVDEAVSKRAESGDGVSSRLLLWDMLSVAYADGHYDQAERKLVRHIARTVIKERSIYPEMEHLMNAAQSVREELTWITSSDRPYAEVQPVVEALREREETIRLAATQLVADEMVPKAPAAITVHKDVFDLAKENVDQAVTPVIGQVQQGMQDAADTVKQAVANVPGVAQAGNAVNSAVKSVGDALNPVGDEVRKQASNAAREAQKQAEDAANAVKGFVGGLFGGKR